MDQASPPKMETYARKRMLRDILEWNACSHEVPMITAAPMQENVFEWHINMNATTGILKDITLHLVLTFPGDYPKQPPSIRIPTYFPHTNVFESYGWHWNHKWKWTGTQSYWICLDMLKRKTEAQKDRQVVTDAYHGWSAGYSVSSVLLQLSSFLYEDKTEQENYFYFTTDHDSSNTRTQIKGKKRMIHEAINFACKKCGHSAKVPYPPLNEGHHFQKPLSRATKRKKNRKKNRKEFYKINLKEAALEKIAKENQEIEGKMDQTAEGTNNNLDDTLQIQLIQNQRLKNIIKRDDKIQQNGHGVVYKKSTKNMWLFLYYDVERLIVSHLTLKDLMKLQTISLHHMKLVETTKILQIHRFGCWYHRVDLSFHGELNKIRGKFHGWNDVAMLNFKTKTNESNRVCYNLILGYGIIPQFYDGSSSFGSHIHRDDLKAMKQAQRALQSGKLIKSQKEGESKRRRNDDEEKVGYSRDPLSFPLLKEVKATFDLLSSDAYLNHNIHTTPWNDQSFHHWIPIYVNEKHGEIALNETLEDHVLHVFSKHDPSIKE
eukprot:66029_1